MQFRLWLESLKTKDFIDKTPIATKVSDWLLHQPQIRKFLADVDEAALIKPLNVGKTGVLVLSKSSQYQPLTGIQHYDDTTGNSFQHRIPVKITGFEGGNIRLERTDSKDFSEIAYKFPYFPVPRSKAVAEFPASRIILVDQERYQTYLRWITYAVTKGSQDAQSKIPSYFAKFWTGSEAGLKRSLANPGIMSQLRTTDLPPDHFTTTAELPNVNKNYRGGKGGAGRVIATFPNGFKWLSLDRQECRAEADAGGHCGNGANPQPGDNVLSLRDKDDRVYLTFVINNGELSEMKGNGNKKPAEDLHPYIIKLLEDPMVKTIGDARYLPENNFQITDLDYENLMRLSKSRPDLAQIDKFDMKLIKNRNNMGKFLKKMHDTHPHVGKLNVMDYDFEKRAFRLSAGEILSGHRGGKEGWRETAWGIINKDNLNVNHGIELVRDNFADLPSETLLEFSKYFLANIDSVDWKEAERHHGSYMDASRDSVIEALKSPKDKKLMTKEKFAMLVDSFMDHDKNVEHVFNVSYHDAYRETAADEINKELRYKTNADGVFYQVKPGKFSEVMATKYIGKDDFRKLMKDPEAEPDTEAEEISLDWLHVMPHSDIYMHKLVKNVKFLHYKVH